jgi:hypothetical protein
VVEVKLGKIEGTGRVAIDLGETILMTCAFDDGTVFLYPAPSRSPISLNEKLTNQPLETS